MDLSILKMCLNLHKDRQTVLDTLKHVVSCRWKSVNRDIFMWRYLKLPWVISRTIVAYVSSLVWSCICILSSSLWAENKSKKDKTDLRIIIMSSFLLNDALRFLSDFVDLWVLIFLISDCCKWTMDKPADRLSCFEGEGLGQWFLLDHMIWPNGPISE